jgi:hypothetical protein
MILPRPPAHCQEESLLAGRPHLGYHGPRGTPQVLGLLGTMPDEEVAAQIGKMPTAVWQKR